MTPEERLRADPALLAELQAFLKKDEADSARLDAESARLGANLAAHQRAHEARELAKRLGELRGGFTFDQSNQWQQAFDRLLAQHEGNQQ
jgi:hypothetical protein